MYDADTAERYPSYLQLSLAFRDKPTAFLGEGLLSELWQWVEGTVDRADVLRFHIRDKGGAIGSRRVQRPTAKSFEVTSNEADAFSMIIAPRSDRWEPPILSLGVSRPGLARSDWLVSWSLLETAVTGLDYCTIATRHLTEVWSSGATAFGFAGRSHEPSSGALNTPLFAVARTHDSVDLQHQVAGVHWLNLVPRMLITNEMLNELTALGSKVRVGEVGSLVELAETPSALNDDLVEHAMHVVEDLLPPATRGVSASWWRYRVPM